MKKIILLCIVSTMLFTACQSNKNTTVDNNTPTTEISSETTPETKTESITLEKGEYTVGTDISQGEFTASIATGETAIMDIFDNDTPIAGEMLNDGNSSVSVKLEDGQTIKISLGKVLFESK